MTTEELLRHQGCTSGSVYTPDRRCAECLANDAANPYWRWQAVPRNREAEGSNSIPTVTEGKP